MMEHDHSIQATTTLAPQRSTGGTYQGAPTSAHIHASETDE